MNDEKQQTEIKQMMDSLVCENLSDEQYCMYHRAMLELFSVANKEENLLLPMDLYCKYKGFVKLSDKTYREIQACDWRNGALNDLEEMYHCYRTQAETQYRILCGLIVSTYQNTTIPEERETLKSIIDGICNITRG